ncbi:DUF116 domain-containing protein [Candidatus Bathyarchaeota archaeon]|nr:DUF116 domain-containing protein [Candidatus Bathyarchaeota archaeon]
MDRQSGLMRTIEGLARLRLSEFAVSRLERVAARMGVDEKRVLELYVAAKNNVGRGLFNRLPYSERIILLPQCLRSRDCPARADEGGYLCVDCGRCRLGQTIRMAEALGYKRAIVISGGSVVPKIFTNLRPRGCLGVGCLKELVLGSFVCEKFGVAGQGLPLLKDGCFETDLDWDMLERMMNSRSGLAVS